MYNVDIDFAVCEAGSCEDAGYGVLCALTHALAEAELVTQLTLRVVDPRHRLLGAPYKLGNAIRRVAFCAT